MAARRSPKPLVKIRVLVGPPSISFKLREGGSLPPQ